MWEGKWTEELNSLYDEYEAMFGGMSPDMYEEVMYEDLTYEKFVECIKECLKTGKEMDVLYD